MTATTTMASPTTAKPFVKWAGGKRALLPTIEGMLPPAIETYWEPMLGGGAVFFGLHGQFERAVISDINEDLMLAFDVVKNRPDELIERLREHAAAHDKDYYYEVRGRHELTDPVERAARLIYLNRTCFNGLWRVNKSGQFNVPIGSYKNPVICDEDNLRNVSAALEDAEIRCCGYENIDPGPGDFVYIDPPYHDTFAAYDADGFGEDEHIALRDAAWRWWKTGARVMLSNSDTPFVRDIYANFFLHEVENRRSIRPTSGQRVTELLITSYWTD